jgi:hypothetical protein
MTSLSGLKQKMHTDILQIISIAGYIFSNLFYQYSEAYSIVMPVCISAPLKQLLEEANCHVSVPEDEPKLRVRNM